jgi:hypothetical protein
LKDSLVGLKKGKQEIEELKTLKSENIELIRQIENLEKIVKKDEKSLKNLEKYQKNSVNGALKTLQNEAKLISKEDWKALYKKDESYQIAIKCVNDYEGGYLYLTKKYFFINQEKVKLSSIVELMMTTWCTIEPALHITITYKKESDQITTPGMVKKDPFSPRNFNIKDPFNLNIKDSFNIKDPFNLKEPLNHLNQPFKMFKELVGQDGESVELKTYALYGFEEDLKVVFEKIQSHLKTHINQSFVNGVNILGNVQLDKEVISKFDEGYAVSKEMKEEFGLPDDVKIFSATHAVNKETNESGTFYIMNYRLCFDGHKRGRQSDMNVIIHNIDYIELLEGEKMKISDISTQVKFYILTF